MNGLCFWMTDSVTHRVCIKSGSGGDLNPPQNLTRPDLKERSAMATTPDCRVASASFFAPARCSGDPDVSEPRLSTADILLQRQLDELVAIHRQLRGLLAPSQSVADLEPPLPCSRHHGDFLLILELRRLRHAMTSLEAECRVLVGTAQTRLHRTRSAVYALRKVPQNTDQRQGEVCHVHA